MNSLLLLLCLYLNSCFSSNLFIFKMVTIFVFYAVKVFPKRQKKNLLLRKNNLTLFLPAFTHKTKYYFFFVIYSFGSISYSAVKQLCVFMETAVDWCRRLNLETGVQFNLINKSVTTYLSLT